MPITHKNRVKTTVSAVASAGLGAFTISTASSGYRTFAAGDDGKSFDCLITEGTAWEVRQGCTYTHSGTSLARGTLEDSSTGSAVAFTAAAVVSVIPSAGWGAYVESLLQATTPGGRLTLESGVPVSTTDQTAKTTVYYTPYLHNTLLLWDGLRWAPTVFAETSLAVGTVTSGANYDVFGYLSGGALALEKLIWTNDTTRATAVTLQDGRYCKSGDKTRLYLGTFRSTSATTTEDSETKRFVFSHYNRAPRKLLKRESTGSWSYTGTWRSTNASTSNRVEVVSGLGNQLLDLTAFEMAELSSGGFAHTGIGVNSTSTNSADATVRYGSSGQQCVFGLLRTIPAAGYSYYQQLEYAETATINFYSADASNRYQTGMHGTWQC